MKDEPVDSMVPLLCGWLAGTLLDRGREMFRITNIIPEDARTVTSLRVRFASGLVLKVQVAVEESLPGD